MGSSPASPQYPAGRRIRPVLAGLGLALVLAAGLLLGLGGPGEAAAAKTTLSLQVSKSSVVSGGSATVTATLKHGRKALPRAAVRIQKRDAGTGTWRTAASARTDARGKLAVKVGKLRRSTEFRAAFAGTSGTPGSVSRKEKVTVTKAGRSTAPSLLQDAARKETALRLVSSAENSSTDWRDQYRYIEDIGDGRGYSAGLVGFCSGTGDMLELIEYYTRIAPDNRLAAYLPALRKVEGSSSHRGLDGFPQAWREAADKDPLFRRAQEHLRDTMYFEPAVSRALADGLGPLGQFIYFDAMVMHGPGRDPLSFGGIRAAALKHAKTPAQGGKETAWLEAFLDARDAVMLDPQDVHQDLSRTIAQRRFLAAGNLDLKLPLAWKMYGDKFSITAAD